MCFTLKNWVPNSKLCSQPSLDSPLTPKFITSLLQSVPQLLRTFVAAFQSICFQQKENTWHAVCLPTITPSCTCQACTDNDVVLTSLWAGNRNSWCIRHLRLRCFFFFSRNVYVQYIPGSLKFKRVPQSAHFIRNEASQFPINEEFVFSHWKQRQLGDYAVLFFVSCFTVTPRTCTLRPAWNLALNLDRYTYIPLQY